jgi:glutamate--cysteine ligase
MSSFDAFDESPVTEFQQLVDYFVSGAKPKDQWRIGTEHEKIPFRLGDNQPVGYADDKGIRDLLHVLRIYGWREVMEGSYLIGLERGGASISLEPAGQVELSGRPVEDLHQTAAEIDQHLEELQEVARLLNIGFLGIGFHPTAERENLGFVPKRRYEIMRNYLPKRGSMALDMMQRSCTTQVNLDYADEADMVLKMRVAMALQPVATALFAASPFANGKDTGYQSWRMRVWQDVDPDRCGFLPMIFEDDFGFARYAEYALDVPMLCLKHGDTLIDVAGLSFRDFMAGKCPALPREFPTLCDWQDHLSGLFPDVRLRRYLEMRGADCGSREMILALPSFWTGLLYDAKALSAAWDLVKDLTLEARQALHRDAPRFGLSLPWRDGTLCDLAHQTVILAQQGLRRRAQRLHGGADETRYLDGLLLITESGNSQASELQFRLQHQWEGDIDKLYRECRLLPSS